MAENPTTEIHLVAIDADAWPFELRELQELAEESLIEWQENKPASMGNTPDLEWLYRNGYAQLAWAIKKVAEVGTRQFYLLFSSAHSRTSEIVSESQKKTMQLLRGYLEGMAEPNRWVTPTHRNLVQPDAWTASMKHAHREQLHEVICRFIKEHGVVDLVTELNNPATEAEVRAAFRRVADTLTEDVGAALANTYLRTINRFCTYLRRSSITAYNPVTEIASDRNFDAPAVTTSTVRALWNAAETPGDRVLILGLCFWGLNLSGVSMLHIDDLELEVGRTDILFTSPGGNTVVLPFGTPALATLQRKRLSEIRRWNGHLYSNDGDASHAPIYRLRQRFIEVRDRMDPIQGDSTCTPEECMAFCRELGRIVAADLRGRRHDGAGMIHRGGGGETSVSLLDRDPIVSSQQRHGHRYWFVKSQMEAILPL